MFDSTIIFLPPLLLLFFIILFTILNKPDNKNGIFRRNINHTHVSDETDNLEPKTYRFKPKPLWVKKEVIRLKVFLIHMSCRKLADEFNRRQSIKGSASLKASRGQPA